MAVGKTYTIDLTPIDPILFRDARSAIAGEDHHAKDTEPSPHTFFGAIGGNIAMKYGVPIREKDWNGSDISKVLGNFSNDISSNTIERAELLGYTFRDNIGNLFFPKPEHLVLSRNDRDQVFMYHLARLCEKHYVSSDALTHYLASVETTYEDTIEAYIGYELIKQILCGSFVENQLVFEKKKDELKKWSDSYIPKQYIHQLEERQGLAINYQTNTAKKQHLFTRPYNRFFSGLGEKQWGIAGYHLFYNTLAEIPKDKLDTHKLAFLGGDRGRAVIDFSANANKPLADILESVLGALDNKAKHYFVYLLTPAVREMEWPRLNGISPVAAAIGKPVFYSGWNSNQASQKPRPTVSTIPSGSIFVYPWHIDDVDERKEYFSSIWLSSLNEGYKYSGFGRILPGILFENEGGAL